MAQPSTRPAADGELDGNLAAFLRQWRTNGDSYETISRRLAVVFGVDVSAATVRRWCNDDAPSG